MRNSNLDLQWIKFAQKWTLYITTQHSKIDSMYCLRVQYGNIHIKMDIYYHIALQDSMYCLRVQYCNIHIKMDIYYHTVLRDSMYCLGVQYGNIRIYVHFWANFVHCRSELELHI